MRRRVCLFSFLVLTTLAPALSAQTTVNAPISWTTHDIKSKVLGTDRQYFVSLPPNYAATKARLPVLILLDANDQPQFVAALANLRFLASRSEAPDLIVVGIPNGPDRTHDLSPVTHAAPEMKMFPTAGGADAFVTFLSEEVLPAVRANYRTTSSAFLAGHSFGGIFALYAAAARPGTFNGAIAMSPSLQWNDAKYVVEYADLLTKQTKPSRLFVTSGGLEPPIDINTKRFIARLDSVQNKAVNIKYVRYPENTHGMTPQPSLVDGVRYLFQPVSLATMDAALASLQQNPDSAEVMKIVDDAEKRYAEGARSLGMPEMLPEAAMNQVGYAALELVANKGVAVALFRRNVDRYPGSANVYDSLGDALHAAGDREAARAAYAKSVEIAKQTGDPVLPESQRKLDALR